MQKQLRDYLESIGLRAGASDADAWAFMADLEGDQLAEAEQIRDQLEPAARADAAAGDAADDGDDDQAAARADAADPRDIAAQAIADERDRVAAIRGLAGDDVPTVLVDQAIAEGWDTARAAGEFLGAVRRNRNVRPAGGPAIRSRSHDGLCTLAALGAAMMIRAGLDPVADHANFESGSYRPRREGANTDHLERAADAGYRFRDMSLVDLCREAVRLDGGRVGYDRLETIRAAVSGSALTNIFTTTFSAQLLAGYTAAGDTTALWTSTADVPNFQSNERAQMGKFGALKKLARGGTAEHLDTSDSKEEYKIARYAGQWVCDEQDIVDDRFGALESRSPREMGESASQLRPDLVYAILLANAALQSDSVALFHATHANLQAGAALASATLKAAITALDIQTVNGRVLDQSGPKVLLTPQTLSFTADELINSSQIVIAGTGVDVTERGNRNTLANRALIGVSDARLDNGVTDPSTETAYSGSTSTWYLAKPSRPTIEVGFLRGSGRAPRLRSFQLTQGQYGIGFDVMLDIGAKAIDYRGLNKATA